ncbi:MAG: hypothetical protein ACI8Q1_002648 [Parvicella sp.]
MTDETPTAAKIKSFPLRLTDPLITKGVWPCPEDRLGRAKEIENLSPVLLNVQAPLVFAIDAPWGGGKTTFIKLWETYFETQGQVSLHLNAWESDFAEDPLLPMLSVFNDWLLKENKEGVVGKAWSKAKDLAPNILKNIFVAGVKVATLGVVDADKAVEAAIAGAAGDMTGNIVDSFNSKLSALTQFKIQLTETLKALPADQPNLIIFIDELDRCRPTYAIEVLERIKHLFDIDRIVFVLAINRDQLSKSIQGVYGANFDGEHYLKRFIDLEYQLHVPNREPYINAQLQQSDLVTYFNARSEGSNDLNWIIKTLCWLCGRFNYTFRDINQLITRLRLIIKSIPSNHHLDPEILCVMLFLRDKDEHLYRRYVDDASCTNEVINFLLGGPVETQALPEAFSVVAGTLLESVRKDNSYNKQVNHWKNILEGMDKNDNCYSDIEQLIGVAAYQGARRHGGNIRKVVSERIDLLHQITITN